jgi:hypothetical protein
MKPTHRVLIAFAAILLGVWSCDGSGAPDPGVPTDGPLFAVATTMFLPDGPSSFVSLVADPTANVQVSRAGALEVGGAAALFGVDGRSVFALGGSDSPTITRYEVRDDGRFIEGARMSLAGLGFGSAFKRSGLVPFLSETKAYFLDDVTAQAVIWNPAEMTIVGSLSLAAAERTGWTFELGERAVGRDGLLFVGASQRGDDETDSGRAYVLVIDTATDTLVTIIEDDRCGNVEHVIPGGQGALYFGSGALAANMHALQRPAGYPAPCVLRINAGETRFDPSFVVRLPEQTAGRSTGRLVAGNGNEAYVLAFYPEELAEPLGPTSDIFAPWDATAWRWWRIRLDGSAPGEPVEGAPVGSAAGRILHAGGRDYINHVDAETGTSMLLVVDAAGGLAAGLRFPGLPYGLQKLR